MSEDDLKKMKELDEVAEKAGGLVAIINNNDVHYDYRKINEYCREKGIEPIDLTIRELQKFIIA